MVNLETVLVLGAGASKDFGFPTGRELVRKVRQEVGAGSQVFGECAKELKLNMADSFLRSLEQADPLSVDAWLEHNSSFIEVGKVAIAITLLHREAHSELGPENNWYQLLFERLNSPFDRFQDNRLSIITFNYDRSLEQYLFKTFRYTHTAKTEEKCKEKLNQLRIVHVYGSLGRLEWQRDDPKHPMPQVPYGGAGLDQKRVLSAAKSIKIIPEDEPLGIEFGKAQDWIKSAKALYFLGYGYNMTNMERLGLGVLGTPTKVMGTTHKLSYQRIREVERLNIRKLKRKDGLFPEPVYEFLHNHVDFNEGGYPKQYFQD